MQNSGYNPTKKVGLEISGLEKINEFPPLTIFGSYSRSVSESKRKSKQKVAEVLVEVLGKDNRS